jgi:hypothetical protein
VLAVAAAVAHIDPVGDAVFVGDTVAADTGYHVAADDIHNPAGYRVDKAALLTSTDVADFDAGQAADDCGLVFQ